MSSIASSNNNRPPETHLKLIQAAAAGREDDVRILLAEHPNWTTNPTSQERDALRQALQRVSSRGNVKLMRLLLESGAEIDVPRTTTVTSEVAAVFRAAESGHVEATRLLIGWRTPDKKPITEIANEKDDTAARTSIVIHENTSPRSRRGSHSQNLRPRSFSAGRSDLMHQKSNSQRRVSVASKMVDEARDRSGRTALFPASVRGYVEVVRVLLAAGADVNARDKDDRTALCHLAAEKLFRLNDQVIKVLLDAGADTQAQDSAARTPLMWACVNGKSDFVKTLFTHSLKNRIDTEAVNARGRTALHFAAESNQLACVELLIANGSNVKAASDGRWTALHNAADKGCSNVVMKLLEAGAKINAVLDTGMTALHYAALNGHKEVVEILLQRSDVELNLKDIADRTPLLCAAEKGHTDIVDLLRPERKGQKHKLPPNALKACESFKATIVDFGINDKPQLQRRIASSIYDLLYGWDSAHNKEKVPTQIKNIKIKPAFRWIHLPANNLAWVDDLLTKVFVESGGREIEDFKALQKAFNQEHRGPMVQGSFMRPYTHRIPPMTNPRDAILPLSRISTEVLQVESVVPGNPTQTSPTTPAITVSPGTPMKGSLANLAEKDSPATPPKKKTKAERFAERHAKKHSTNSPKSTPNSTPKAKQEKVMSPTVKTFSQNGKLILFMPYLHYELDTSRRAMSAAIHRTYRHNDPRLGPPPINPTSDDLLIESYLRRGVNAPPGLHARRTLDQFFYHGIDTSERDQDQVVWRYCDRHNMKKKIFMVDQLWMWVLGKDLIITSFPQRWQQQSVGRRDDPLNVLEGIIQDSNVKTREPKSVWDLAMIITARCAGMFDRHRLDDSNYQFVDMFESSIGRVTDRETKLFDRFNKASEKATEWLKDDRRSRGSRKFLLGQSSRMRQQDAGFVDLLLSIGHETKLLAEIKDIREELNIIKRVLEEQKKVLPDFAENITDELGGKRNSDSQEIRRRKDELVKVIQGHIDNLNRMDKQAELIYGSLTNLLDLKQKHANAFEARFARAQAALTAKQEQTIMVFTIVTILFLPMSVISSILDIPLSSLPKDSDGNQDIPLSYMSKYVFGVGLSISIPLILLSLWLDDLFAFARSTVKTVTLAWKHKKSETSNVEDDEGDWRTDFKDADYEKNMAHKQGRLSRSNDSRSSLERDMSPLSENTRRRSIRVPYLGWDTSSANRSMRDSLAS